MVKIKLHGKLGKQFKSEYLLKVSSVSEALHAIDSIHHSGFRRYMLDQKNVYKKWTVLTNGKRVDSPQKIEDLKTNEINLRVNNLETIDIIPVLEGSGLNDWLSIFLGVIGLAYGGTNPFTMIASVALLMAGLSNLLSEPPEMPEQKDIVNPSSDPTQLAKSYLFSGPVNVLNEGGPVPLGYGRLIVGSQVVMSAYEVRRVLTKDAGRVL